MNLYAESSAVLAWLLEEVDGARVRQALANADVVVASDLTIVECDRVLIRAVVTGDVSEAEAADRRGQLATAAAHWQLLRMAPEVIDRARLPFPGEPIRTLDAIHLASALLGRSSLPGLALLSLDHRIRTAAELLGFPLRP